MLRKAILRSSILEVPMNSRGCARLGGLLSLVLLVVTPLWPQTSPIQGVSVSSEYDRAKGMVTIHIINFSHKDISAFGIQETTFYTDGTSDTIQSATDYLPGVISRKLAGGSIEPSNGALAAGAEKTLEAAISKTKSLDKFVALPTFLVYTDGSSEVANRQEFNALMARRKGQALALQRANDLINKTIDANDPHPVATVVSKLKELQSVPTNTSQDKDNPETWVSHGYNLVVTELSRLSPSSQQQQVADLHKIVQHQEARASEMLAQSQGVQP